MDDSTLLCEACGYELTGLSLSAACPECGRPVATSLPSARPGTAWQRGPGFFSWVRTNWTTLVRPTAQFTRLRIERRTWVWLLIINCWLAGVAIADPWVGTLIGDPVRSWRGTGPVREIAAYAVMWILEGASVGLVLFLLTAIECAGVRFFAARRGWRLTRSAAWQVCAHASVGWGLCGALAMLVLAAYQSVVRLTHSAPSGFLDLRPFLPRLEWNSIALGGGTLLGYGLGLLAFEWLVYRGVRECRYAARGDRPATIEPAVSS